MTLASHGTPEQPSPRTARSQTMFSGPGCKFHDRANGWHEVATHFCKHHISGDLQKRDRGCLHLIPVTAVICPKGITIDDCWQGP